jgi:hypothetical protein
VACLRLMRLKRERSATRKWTVGRAFAEAPQFPLHAGTQFGLRPGAHEKHARRPCRICLNFMEILAATSGSCTKTLPTSPIH